VFRWLLGKLLCSMLTWLPGFFRSSYLWLKGTHKHFSVVYVHMHLQFSQ
jgi:hypothetical protein